MFTILVMRPEFEAYANIVYGHLEMAGYNVRKDSNYELALNGRVRTHEATTLCIIGYEEQETRSVSIRERATNEQRILSLNEFFEKYH
jgi:threonyl-tRNA synthetase